MAIAQGWAEKAPGTPSRVALSDALVSVGRREEAVKVARSIAAQDPGMNWFLAAKMIWADHFEEATDLLRPLARVGNPYRANNAGALLLALTYQGRIREALKVVEDHEGLPGSPSWFGLGMGWNVLAAGRNNPAALRKALALDEADIRRGLPGSQLTNWYLKVGQDGEAAKAAARLTDPEERRLYEALLAWRRKDFKTALDGLRTLDQVPARNPWVVWWHSYVARDAGEDAESVAATDRFEVVRFGNPATGGEMAELVYRKAQSQERLGDTAGARATIERLLRWWKRADPDLPLLAEAKALCRKLGCTAPK